MPIQVPNLDDRSYDAILAEAIARIPVHTPEWNNFNDSDPGMTLMQLFAFMSENLLYRSNRMPEATRLKFLKLLGIPLRPASAARGLVTFINERGPAQALSYEEGLEIYAGKVPFRTRTPVNILPVEASVFYKKAQSIDDLDDATIKRYRNLYPDVQSDEELATFGFYQAQPLEPPEAGQRNLPEVNISKNSTETRDNALWLALVAPKHIPPANVIKVIGAQTLSLGVYPAELGFQKQLLPQTTKENTVISALSFHAVLLDGAPGQHNPPRVQYKKLDVQSAEDVLEMPGIVQIKLPDESEIRPYSDWGFDPVQKGIGNLPPFIEDNNMEERIVLWVRITMADVQSSASQRGRIAYIGVNAARVIQALRVENERLGIGTGTPNQSFKVTNTPIVTEVVPESTVGQTPSAQSFQLQVTIGATTETWRMTDDLYAAQATDKVYSLDPESGQVTFGDGLRGARPPRGSSIYITYEYGGGPDGAIAIAALNKSSLLPSGVKASNPVPTWGASSSENAADGERRISSYLRHKDRLVTVDDYHEITLRTPGVDIARVEVLPLFQPTGDNGKGSTDKAGCITVMVVPNHDVEQTDPPDITKQFLQAIADWLAPRRLVTTQVYIQAPTFRKLAVSMGIVTLPGHSLFVVHDRVKKAIRHYLSPLVGGLLMTESNGERVGKGWQLGTHLSVQDLVAEASRVEGVRYVESTNVQLGELTDSGMQPNTKITLEGLQLPWLSIIDVQEGTPTPLNELGGSTTGNPNTSDGVPVPLLPTKC